VLYLGKKKKKNQTKNWEKKKKKKKTKQKTKNKKKTTNWPTVCNSHKDDNNRSETKQHKVLKLCLNNAGTQTVPANNTTALPDEVPTPVER